MPELRTDQDDRLSSGSDAPEVDHAICAPEYRTDNTAPEVAPGRDAQVYYSTSPPEATEIDCPETNDQFSATQDAPTKGSHRKFLICIIVLAIIVGVSLSIGLGVGLKSQKDNAKSRKDNTGQASNNTSAPPASRSSNSSVPKPVPKHGPHTVMDNTPISAVTLPNNNRHLYFREQTGAIRRSIFSPSAQFWQTAIDARLPGNARNNTPIAVTPGFELEYVTTISPPELKGSHLEFKRPDNLNDVILFYVNSTDQLEFVGWQTDDLNGCAGLTDPLPSVSPNSSHISAGLYDFNDGGLGLLLTYQNSSRDLVMMLGYVDSSDNNWWTWQDETEQLPACSSNECPYGNSTTCSMQSSTIFCLGGTDFHACSANFTSANQFRLWCVVVLLSNPLLSSKPGGEAAPLALGDGNGALLSIHNSTLQSNPESLPPPQDVIPYDHIASTDSINLSKIYVYYQLNDATFVENLWDGTSWIWIPTNITIATG